MSRPVRARIANCLICAKEFRAVKDFKTPSGARHQKYCSKDCWSVRSTIYNVCKYCGSKVKTSKAVNKQYCDKSCRDKGYAGIPHSKEHRQKISEGLKGKIPKNAWKSGDKHPMWNPDRTDYRERYGNKYQEWRYAVIKRDKYTCQICGDKRSSGKMFDVDHIKPFSLYPELRFEVSNGRVLCRPCHIKTDTWGRKKPKIEGWENGTPAI